MAYIGKEPVVGNFQVCDAISVVNGQAAYSLTVGGAAVNPESESHMLVSLNGVLQKPGSSFTTSDANPISSNLERNDDSAPSFGYYGSQMSESSGVFTFPSTGIYHVLANIQFYLNGDNQYTGVEIAATANNSSYGARAVNYSHIKNVSNPTYSFVHCNAMFDITDTTNQKVRFRVVATSSSTTIVAATDYDHTFFRFIRLGDT